ncbi:MAG: hypothetical protein IJV64_00755, partial [Oscillospiraceae bacterium]|nr:hypothetical protein [Oscillospiraceae bacterium]
WTVERESGVDFAFYTNSEDYGSWGRVDVRSDDIGQAAGDEVLKITCDWGGQTEITRTTVHVLNAPNGLPTGLDYPREVSTQVGTTLTIAPSIMPAGWTLPGCTPSITFNGGEMEQFATQVTQSDTEAVFQVNTPGVFKALVMMSADTITIGHEVTFSVADENGNVPAAALYVGVNWYNGSDSERDFYLVPDYDGNMLPSRVQSTSAITSMWLNEFDSSSAAPVWSLTADAAEAQASLQEWSDLNVVSGPVLRLQNGWHRRELQADFLKIDWSRTGRSAFRLDRDDYRFPGVGGFDEGGGGLDEGRGPELTPHIWPTTYDPSAPHVDGMQYLHPTDAPNPGTSLVGYTFTLQPHQKVVLHVCLSRVL